MANELSSKEQKLSNFLKYCLGYIKLTRQRTFAAQQRSSAELPRAYFSLLGLLNGDIDGEVGEKVNLRTFYDLDPKQVTKKQQKKYEEEKAIAGKLERIYNEYRNNPFQKQIVFNFGYFEIELPVIELEEEFSGEEEIELESAKTKIDRYPLFSLIVKLEKEDGEYVVHPVDTEVHVNVGMLESILGEDLYYQLIEEVGKYELDNNLILPLDNETVFLDVWHKIKERLRHTKARYDENSFSLEEFRLTLSPRANYFLAEDLQKLSKLSVEDLDETALTCWVDDTELNQEGEIPHDKNLYFPFLYDQYKLRVLSIIGNKAGIVEGPPGTGKSETIANLLCHLAANGKRVLFVSQKAQALKVVKDKLKKLGVRYLFGYIPNPRSAQIGEEDELDGVAPQLAQLDSHIERLGYRFHARRRFVEYTPGDDKASDTSLEPLIRKRNQLQDSFVRSLETERELWKSHQELKTLSAFSIPISNLRNFQSNFSGQQWKLLLNLEEGIAALSARVSDYEKSESRKKFDRRFQKLGNWNNQYTQAVGAIRDDVAKSGYDGHSGLMRKVSNTLRSFRMGETTAKLPREVRDYVDELLSAENSRAETKHLLDELFHYASHHSDQQNLTRIQEKFTDTLKLCGISQEEFRGLKKLIISTEGIGVEGIKKNILHIADIKGEISGLHSTDLNSTSEKLKGIESERSKRIALYLQNIINHNIIDKWKTGVTIKQIVKKLAKAFGKSKKAFKTFDRLRSDPDNFNAILDLIPVWIMELDDASRFVPLEAGVFDYVILDEASQCNIAYTLPAMYRAKKALFFGDSEQMKDSTVIFKSNRSFDELARRYQIPEELQIKATGSGVQSVLEIAGLRGITSVPLRYYYRSPEELIGFSNQYFYKPKGKELITLNSNYLTYKDTDRVMLTHHVDAPLSEEISDRENIAEAKVILSFFKDLRSDERYADKSVGILSFFNDQANRLRRVFEDEGFKEGRDNYKISIVEGIQGDEKDIILYSFVIRDPDQKNRYLPLTGEGGDISADVNRGRVNVAFSRAKLQTHCFVSMPVDEFPERIWIKKYLKYVQDNGEVDFYRTELKPFDSQFEEEFYSLLKSNLKKGYRIQNQVESCGFKIDFVVNNVRNGKRIAIECDGPTHFRDEIDEASDIYVEDDEERQRILEAAGWHFFRVKYSDWIDEKVDKDSVIASIRELLA